MQFPTVNAITICAKLSQKSTLGLGYQRGYLRKNHQNESCLKQAMQKT